MIYVVSNQVSLFDSNEFKFLSVEESLNKLSKWDCIQYDSETTGRDPHLCTLLCVQFGNIEGTEQIIVDTSTVNIKIYKNILENSYLIGQNLKFDLQFLYNYSIIPRKVYDTMIVEQFLYLGYPTGIISYSLKSIAERRLGIDIDKSVRGEIIWRGLDTTVIKYAAGDVQYLGDIMKSQIEDLKKRTSALIGAKIECDFTPAIAYLEWCGIKLDEKKWKDKMNKDLENLRERKKSLDKFLVNNNMNKYFHINKQGDLFEGFSTEPVIDINWSSSTQVIKVAKDLGFDTQVKDKKTGENKDSVLEKHLKTQKGINDEFLKLYFDYQESAKVVSSFGQGHLNSINPKTGRLHTQFKALGASSGRMSCGSNKPNIDLAKYKQLPSTACKYLNLQQLPSDELTRSCFIAPKGYKFVSADFSAEESRLAADIYQDKEFLKEFTTGSKDTHNMFAWIVYNKECKECGCKDATEVKEKAPKWRKLVKGFEFGYMFGAAAPTLAQTANCSVENAQAVIDKLDKAFYGMASFAKKGLSFVKSNGYIIINPKTGHRLNWWDWEKWKKDQEWFNSPGFWDDYKNNHKGTGDSIALKVREHFQAVGKYGRLCRNVVTQGTGAIILKTALTNLFNWIIDNGYFNKIHLCCAVHDEICADYPEEVKDFPNILETIMEKSAAKFCKSLPIPAEASVGDCWIH